MAYGLGYSLDLFSNFTYFLDDPVHGDQFEQLDDRNAYGLKATHRWLANWFGFQADNEVGVQGRFDDIHRIGLFHTDARQRISTTRLDRVQQWNAALFFQNDMQWAPRFRTILGLRGDYYDFDVTGNLRSRERRPRVEGHRLAQAVGDLRALRPDRALCERRIRLPLQRRPRRDDHARPRDRASRRSA